MKWLVILLALVSSAAFGEGQGGTGGVGFLCDGHVYLADTYDLFSENHRDLLDESVNLLNYSPPEKLDAMMMNALKSYLERQGQVVQIEEIENASVQLKFTYKDKVPRTHDEHIKASPCGGPIVQLASQDSEGNVDMANQAKSMTPVEQSLLKVHEVWLRWLKNKGLFKGNTTPARSEVNKFAKLSLPDLISIVIKDPEVSRRITGLVPSCEKKVLVLAKRAIIERGLPEELYFGRPQVDRFSGGVMRFSKPVVWESRHIDGTYVNWSASVEEPMKSWACAVQYSLGAYPENLPTMRGDYVDGVSQKIRDTQPMEKYKCEVTLDELFVNVGGKEIPVVRLQGRNDVSRDDFIQTPKIEVEVPWSKVKVSDTAVTGSIRTSTGPAGFQIVLNPKKEEYKNDLSVTPRFKQKIESLRFWKGSQTFECSGVESESSY